MDVLYWQSLIQGIVQGLTEFLPVSSTGHLIIADRLMELCSAYRACGGFKKMFDVVVQLGSIVAVVLYFHRKLIPSAAFYDREAFRSTFSIWLKTLVGVFPAILIGALFGSRIQDFLYTPLTVALALIIGGVILIAVDSTEGAVVAERKETGEEEKTTGEEKMIEAQTLRRGEKESLARVEEISSLSYRKAFGIGVIQCLAMIPGTSRSASTIIGGMCLGCSRPLAAEYSFFLAVPTMVAASGYSLLKHGALMSREEWIALGIGFLAAFFVAWGVIAAFMVYIRTHDFKPFGYYRILLGTVILALLYFKVL